MPTVTLAGPLSYSIAGTRFERGKPAPVSRAVAENLPRARFKIDWSDVDPVEIPAVAPQADATPAEDTPRTGIDAVRDAIDKLNVDDETAFEPDGKPAVGALSAVLGREVTAAERDRAMGPPLPATAPGQERRGRATIVRKARDPSTEGAVEV